MNAERDSNTFGCVGEPAHRRPNPMAAAAAPLASSSFPEQSINEITKKGFTRAQAIAELEATNGDVMKALVSLMARSLAKHKRQN